MAKTASEPNLITDILENLHAKYKKVNDGQVATYIPELGKANPGHFGICIASAEGQIFEVGDCDVEFTIQSISKAFVFAMALTSHGRDKVYEKVGVEPSGDAFNAIELDRLNRPYNPMVNAGAIVTAGFIEGETFAARREKLLKTFSAAAGRALKIDEAVYRSESETGHRNRALAWLATNFDKMEMATNMETLELYFMQCSILVNARDLAVMGATLANMGINPITGENVFEMHCIQDVLSVMLTCGMYDYAGEWAFRVGIPAKSGVGGGILGVVNRQLGIGTFSPPLDARGNSVRGIKVCAELSEELGLHTFNFMNHGSHFLKNMMEE
jgi:glutaminase